MRTFKDADHPQGGGHSDRWARVRFTTTEKRRLTAAGLVLSLVLALLAVGTAQADHPDPFVDTDFRGFTGLTPSTEIGSSTDPTSTVLYDGLTLTTIIHADGTILTDTTPLRWLVAATKDGGPLADNVIADLEYWETLTSAWTNGLAPTAPGTGQFLFGPPTGFTLNDFGGAFNDGVPTYFRVPSGLEEGTYTLHLQLMDVTDPFTPVPVAGVLQGIIFTVTDPHPLLGDASTLVMLEGRVVGVGNPFNFPLAMIGVDHPARVQENETFPVTMVGAVVAVEEWIEGALRTAYCTFWTGFSVQNLRDADVVDESDQIGMEMFDVHVRVPAPDGVTGPDVDLNWDPGFANVATLNPDFIFDATTCDTSVEANSLPFLSVEGGLSFPSDPETSEYTVTGSVGDLIDFRVDETNFGQTPPGAAVFSDPWPAKWKVTLPGGLTLTFVFNVADEIFTFSGDPPVKNVDAPLTQQVQFFTAEVIPPPPTVTIDNVVGQHVTTHARSGNTIEFAGVNWIDGGALVTGASLCTDPSDSLTCLALDSPTGGVDGAGNLDGSAVVPAVIAPGAYKLMVETDTPQSSDPDFVPQVTILGTPTLAVNPTQGGLGTPVVLAGSNWNPLADISVFSQHPVTTDVGSSGLALVDSAGVLSGTWTFTATDQALLTPPGDVDLLVVAEDVDLDTSSEAASAPFTFLSNEVVLPGGSRGPGFIGGDPGSALETAQLQQIVQQEITPGVLTFSQQNAVIMMTPIQLDGTTQQSTGAINEVSVVDARGTLEGWTINVTMTDLILAGEDPLAPTTNRFIPAGNVLFTPACSTDHGDPLEITTGAGGALDNAVPQLLCDGAVGGGGGTFRGNALLDATIPPTVASGDYSAIMTLLIF